MRILLALTYYRPHYSGLTIYAERLARALARRGHQVTVLTSRYDRSLPKVTHEDGVRIVRVDVRGRVSKGVLMPGMLLRAWQLVRQADVVNLHVPQLDAAYIALYARLLAKPTVLTYHCDLRLPQGAINALANRVSHLANTISCQAANAIVTNTRDYAEYSPFLKRYLAKVQVIPPPVELPLVSEAARTQICQNANIFPGQRLIGMAARLATEKGVEYLLQAMPAVLARHPTARVLFVGQYQDVFGEEAYAQRLAPLIHELGEHWTFLGVLSPDELAAFYHQVALLVLPSINSTESFGMVQVEAMTCGVPAIASDLPGVRQPVLMTGMGQVVPPADAPALAAATNAILDNPAAYRRDPQAIRQRFASDTIAGEYEALFKSLIR